MGLAYSLIRVQLFLTVASSFELFSGNWTKFRKHVSAFISPVLLLELLLNHFYHYTVNEHIILPVPAVKEPVFSSSMK